MNLIGSGFNLGESQAQFATRFKPILFNLVAWSQFVQPSCVPSDRYPENNWVPELRYADARYFNRKSIQTAFNFGVVNSRIECEKLYPRVGKVVSRDIFVKVVSARYPVA